MKWFFYLLPLSLISQEFTCSAERLFSDLDTAHKINEMKKEEERPVMINYLMQGGYFLFPSARAFPAGVLGAQFTYLPPSHIWSLGFSFFDHFEMSANYGIGGPGERTVNAKWILHRREDGWKYVPNFAIGCNDYTSQDRALYAVATAFCPYHLEASLGWGSGPLHGLYGAVAWNPFKPVILAAEANGRTCKVGGQVILWDHLRLSASNLGWNNAAASATFSYNLGNSKGFLPKTKDPEVYRTPVDTEPLGLIRSRQELAQQLAYALQEQGLDLYSLYFIPDQKDALWMKIVNVRYWEEAEVRRRIEYVLAFLTPSNIQTVTAVIEVDGIPAHEYQFRTVDLQRYAAEKLGETEFSLIAPMREASSPPRDYDAALLYQRRKPIWLITFRPWFRSFLGTNRGKFKYETGFALNPEGYFFDQIYYNISGTYTVKSSNEKNPNEPDAANPSRLINVRTDSILYNQTYSLHLDQAYLQKSWNMGRGCFSRLSLGYFETAYAGLALETLYYPVQSSWAIGVEAAGLLKRGYYGVGFQSKIRKLTADGPRYFPYRGLQYFLDFYYQYKPLHLDFKISAGQFLARDKGARFEAGRTFPSGLRVGLWYTLTNAHDIVNGHTYYDKGFSITMPLDLFLPKSSRTRIGYSMAARLRDCGAVAATGKQLYPTLYWERYTY